MKTHTVDLVAGGLRCVGCRRAYIDDFTLTMRVRAPGNQELPLLAVRGEVTDGVPRAARWQASHGWRCPAGCLVHVTAWWERGVFRGLRVTRDAEEMLLPRRSAERERRKLAEKEERDRRWMALTPLDRMCQTARNLGLIGSHLWYMDFGGSRVPRVGPYAKYGEKWRRVESAPVR